MIRQIISVWAWHCDASHGGYLFDGNPNHELPPFHLGDIENILCGENLTWANTRKVLEMNADVLWWNQRFPRHRVKPQLVTIEIRPSDSATMSRRKKKEGAK